MRNMFLPMKRFGKVLVLSGAVALLMSCATASGPAMTGEQMAAAGVDGASMRSGRILAVTECAECHRFYWPHEYSPEEWPAITRKMGGRASLSKSQIKDLELYFVTMSKATREE